jgi:hypothetical protein
VVNAENWRVKQKENAHEARKRKTRRSAKKKNPP